MLKQKKNNIEQKSKYMEDSQILELINKETSRQLDEIDLIASENYVSCDVLRAVGSVLTNKYAEGYPGRRFYGGCEYVDEVENLAISRAKELFAVDYVNVQPHSGSQANIAALASILSPGDKILSLGLPFGGHLTHGFPDNVSGKIYRVCHYGVDENTSIIDMSAVEKISDIFKPNLIICGASAYSQDFDYESFRKIADKHNAILMCDMSHTAGIIACKTFLNNPFDYCHVVTSTTHKTLRGPRGGMILMKHDFENCKGEKNKKGRVKMMSELIDANVFPGQQGGPFMHIIAGKAVCFAEALQPSFHKYIHQVLNNSKLLAGLFMQEGYDIVSHGTQNHLMLVDLRNKNLTGKEAEFVLGKAGIIVNKNMIPFDGRTPSVTSGIRIGTPAITTRGFREEEIKIVFGFIDQALKHKDDDVYLKGLRHEVFCFCQNFPFFM